MELLNLTLACEPCNTRKGNRAVEDFLKHKPEVLARILNQVKASLQDATAVNTTRLELYRRLQATGLPVETGSGGRTKFNRSQRGLPKTHWLDAACVGASTPEVLDVAGVRPLLVAAYGHGRRQRCITDKYGCPLRHACRAQSYRGFRSGDIVRAAIPNGKHRGTHVGRIAIRHRPSFRLCPAGASAGIGVIDVHPDRLSIIHRADGYAYSLGKVFCAAQVTRDSPAP